MPWGGLALSLLMGNDRLPGRRLARMTRVRAKLGDLHRILDERARIVEPEIEPWQKSTVKLGERLGTMPILGGNDAQFISNIHPGGDFAERIECVASPASIEGVIVHKVDEPLASKFGCPSLLRHR